MSKEYLKGRGAQKKIGNRFQENQYETLDEFRNYCATTGEAFESDKTTYLKIFPKTIVNKVPSPDLRMTYSANPYQGCEHGCVYCYARNSHEYWGYGAGLDFERKILHKSNAAALLEAKITSKNWKGDTIVFSGNTDCYQPLERKLKLTRACLEVLWKWKHPVEIITKNALILRDLDLLQKMASHNLVRINISITTLSEETRRLLEPRTASIKQRLKTVETLTANQIPVCVMMAPIIPSLNSHEILPLVKTVADLGVFDVGYTIVRLNGRVAEIFEDWARTTIPDRADRILNQIADCHDGGVSDSQFGRRMRGSGTLAKQIQTTMALAKNRYLRGKTAPVLDNSHFLQLKNPQFRLFD